MRTFCFTLSFLLTLAACESPFTTRQPEPPDDNSSSLLNPTTPELVFINLRVALQQRNVENYIESLVDTTRSQRRFEFVPDQGVAASQPGTFLDWNLEDERRYVQQMLQAIPADSAIVVDFVTENRSETAVTATITQDYAIFLPRSPQLPTLPRLARGQATFFLERDDTGDWAIYRWEDFKIDTDDFSWSELKALFQ